MRVRLLVLGESPPRLAANVLATLPPPFVGGEVSHAALPVTRCYDVQRAQVDATRLLDVMPESPPGWACVGITAADLFVEPLAYVFGLSVLGGRKGVVSWARLRPDETSEDVLLVTTRRLSVEVVHELGHAIGLIHCVVPDCAMHRSLWPEAVDLKRAAFCPSCFEGLQAATGEVDQMA
ncbi:MAG: peptidase M54 [Acidobacteriota bacterium]